MWLLDRGVYLSLQLSLMSEIWSKLFDPDESNLGWVDCVDMLDSNTWLVIGLSIRFKRCISGIKIEKMKQNKTTTSIISAPSCNWHGVALQSCSGVPVNCICYGKCLCGKIIKIYKE